MWLVLSLGMLVFLLCSCTDANTVRIQGETSSMVSSVPESAKPSCGQRNVMQVRTRRHYEDDHGTMMTTDPSTLATRKTVFRWGIANRGPLEMAKFAAQLKPIRKFNHFNAKIYIDSGIKAPMEFLFRNGDKNGEVLKSVIVNPGQTVGVDFEISSVRRMFVSSELRIDHAKATRVVIGEPEFYNCK